MNGLTSELLKYKRTFTRKLIVFIPMFFCIVFAGHPIIAAGFLTHGRVFSILFSTGGHSYSYRWAWGYLPC